MDVARKETYGLRPSFTPLGIWAFSIGTSIGWGSFIVTCNAYLQKSGILGTAFGLLIGMAVILVIAWNLQYLIRNEPNAGGIYAFERRVGGKDLGFLAAWFVLLTYLAVLWANVTSLPLFARFFLGDTFHVGFHYRLFGYEVWLGEALLSIGAIALIGLLCSRSMRLANRIMVGAALVFTLGFTICAVVSLVRHGESFSYAPLYTEESSAFAQIIRIAVMSPWAFIGFENVAHFSEEYTFSVKRIRRILICSVLVTTAMYLFVSLLSIAAYPPEYESWLDYMRDMGNLSGIKAVPAFYVANQYMGSAGVTVLMLALFGVILTSLIGNMLALSRLLYAAAREGEAPQVLKQLNRHGVPGRAICAVVVASILIPFLGRTAIGWIVDVTTLGATLIYGMLSHAVYKHAKGAGLRREQCTGLIGFVLMACFLLLLLIPGLLPFDAMETESYVLFIVWAVLGLAYFRHLIHRDQSHPYGQRIIVWVILLVLMLFASMMWVSRATEHAANEAIERIYQYHQSHPEHDVQEGDAAVRSAFLQEQANQVAHTNTLYAVVSLGLFVISMTIILNNYKDTRTLGKRLSAAEEARLREEQRAYARINALTGNYLCIYIVDPETGSYREYDSQAEYGSLDISTEGADFFDTSLEDRQSFIHPEDLPRFLAAFTRERVLAEIERSGIFTLTYRFMAQGTARYVQLRAAMVEEMEGSRLVIGITDVDASVRQEEYASRLAQAQSEANVDALTDVKSRRAYLNAEAELDRQIAEHRAPEFAITILDVNDLKKVNDERGHQAGDQYLCDACKIVCDIFNHSPVYRVGGDEFAVISRGGDYARIDELVGKVRDHNAEASRAGGIVVACGMAKYEHDESVAPVFERADQHMYENKSFLKEASRHN